MSVHVYVHSPRSQVSQFVVMLRLRFVFLHVNVSCNDKQGNESICTTS